MQCFVVICLLTVSVFVVHGLSFGFEMFISPAKRALILSANQKRALAPLGQTNEIRATVRSLVQLNHFQSIAHCLCYNFDTFENRNKLSAIPLLLD